MSTVLVVNSGSSSLKYRLLDVEPSRVLAAGQVERIGQPSGLLRHAVFTGPASGAPEAEPFRREAEVPDHAAAFAAMLAAFAEHGPDLSAQRIAAVGHRVVHGGDVFSGPAVVDAGVEREIEELSDLAPLHNPANLSGIRAAREAFGEVPHVAVFDTAFHQTLAPAAYTYAIDRRVAEEHRIRRYGFHGTSHRYVSRAAAEFLERPVERLRQLVFHLGNGASVTAIDRGRSVDTSMGLTPLEGLVMGTRSGDVDPAALLHLARRAGMTADELDALLNTRSGLQGLAGVSDLRDLHVRREAGDPHARLAFEVYAHRLRAYAGAYIAQLGGVDVISFTAGVGENDPEVRAAAMETLAFVGVVIDPERNRASGSGIRVISTTGSPVTVLVVPTDEELEIARQALERVRA